MLVPVAWGDVQLAFQKLGREPVRRLLAEGGGGHARVARWYDLPGERFVVRPAPSATGGPRFS